MRLTETTVALRGHDRRMTKDLLQRGQRATRFQPPTRERVPQLMSVKAIQPGPSSNLLRKPIGIPQRQQSADV